MSYLSDLLGDAYKEGMTEEEISTALQSAGAGAKDNEAEVNRLKAQLSKANSEAADYKKQLRGKQSEDEAAAAEQKATMDKLTQENADLKRSMALSEKKAKLLAMGYDEKLADDTATAMVDTFLESYDFTGKKIATFATSGGSGMGKTDSILKKCAPNADWKEGKRFGSADKNALKAWAESQGM